MSRTNAIRHSGELYRKGERIAAVTLDIDTKNKRVSLGTKQLIPESRT
jgi:small subunit ribosomal protein S1